MNCLHCGGQIESKGDRCPTCGWSANAGFVSSKELTAGISVANGRFEIVNLISTGSLSSVYLGVDRFDGSDVAIRFINPDLLPNSDTGKLFLKSMQPLLNIAHPSMVRVLDFGQLTNLYYVVNEFIEGVPLEDLLDNRKSQGRNFSVKEIYPIMKQLASFLLDSGLDVHGSLSPKNIWILPGKIKVLNAGLIPALPPMEVGQSLNVAEYTKGFVAPEYFKKQDLDRRADVYSLGVLFGLMLTQISFDGRAEMFGEINPNFGEDLDALLRRALLRDPRGRHMNAREFVENIAEVANLPIQKKSSPVRSTTKEKQDMTVQVSMEDVIRAHVQKEAASTIPPPANIIEHQPLYAVDQPASKVAVAPRKPAAHHVAIVAPVEKTTHIRDVTQEIDTSMIKSVDKSSMATAVAKLEAQAADAERLSTEELIKKAKNLDGIDPRFVRAAHSLNINKRSKESMNAARLLRERADELDGIDPRLLRAAARLEEARISDVPAPSKIATDVATIALQQSGETESDWRERISQQEEDSVISFLASPIVDRSDEVRGFPLTQQRRQNKQLPQTPPSPLPRRR